MLPTERYDGDFYPGSKTPVKDYTREKYGPPPELDILPEPYFAVEGGETYWSLSTLAYLLNRTTVTLRRWEANGDLPKTPIRMVPESGSVHGEVRLYTRAMLEGLAKIAYEEGLIAHPHRKLSTTKFKQRAQALFEEVA